MARVKGEGDGIVDDAVVFGRGGFQNVDEVESRRRRTCRPPLKRAKVNWWRGASRR